MSRLPVRETAPSVPKSPEVPLRAVALGKVYPGINGAPAVSLFRGLDVAVNAGEIVAVVGRSGTGKSSLLHLLAGLDRPDGGEITICGTSLGALDGAGMAALRNRLIGYVWQFHYLLPEFSAVENVALPLLARGAARRPAEQAAHRWLGEVGLADRASHRAGELSGGEQQRVAIARALVTEPKVLLADEPTGDLDDETAAHLFALLHGLCRQHALAALLVTHNAEIAHRCDRVLRLWAAR